MPILPGCRAFGRETSQILKLVDVVQRDGVNYCTTGHDFMKDNSVTLNGAFNGKDPFAKRLPEAPGLKPQVLEHTSSDVCLKSSMHQEFIYSTQWHDESLTENN